MLKEIKYPTEPQNIIIMGQPDTYRRSWVVSPLQKGHYSFLIRPKGMAKSSFIFRFDVFCHASDAAPERIEFSIPKRLQEILDWQWYLILWPRELNFSLSKRDVPTNAQLLYEFPTTAKGRFRIKRNIGASPHRLVAWSCNQPFETNEMEEPILNQHSNQIFEWFKNQVDHFSPDLVWGLGDVGYSDGTLGTDFINQYYDQPHILTNEKNNDSLLHAYRRMYKAHWSFEPMQYVMRNYPHHCVWDDHEIRDGWGSEDNDFQQGNTIIYKHARKVAEEYTLNNGPRVRPFHPDNYIEHDAHQAYVQHPIASFIFDGRSSRRYKDPDGMVISKEQLEDFNQFCRQIEQDKKVKFLLMGSAVPFINLIDFIERVGAQLPDVLNELTQELRDDVRDSWHSPGNINQLKDLISILRRLHRQRPDLEFVNISGDIHVANLFSFQPMGFTKALYQVTSSALTNRQHPGDHINDLIQVGTESWSEALGVITRIWETVSDPNILTIQPKGNNLEIRLKVLDLEQETINTSALDGQKDWVYEVGMHRYAAETLV